MSRHEVNYSRKQVLAWLKSRFPSTDWSEVEQMLPPVIWRARWDALAEKLGLPHSRKYIANLDSRGEGPANFEAR